MNKFPLLILLLIFIMASCSKNSTDDPPSGNQISLIDSLVTRTDTIVAMKDTTSITVYTTAIDPVIQWSTDHGTILGSGRRIVYYSGECCIGGNIVTCKVSSENGSDVKSVKIHVKSYFGGG
ncbi:MAG TPA: hypothetical protein PLM34_11390 [Lentimicrobium sp.]|jgi:hypothetical protein|nr:hypothetical protein [Lentimicrobium sp.]